MNGSWRPFTKIVSLAVVVGALAGSAYTSCVSASIRVMPHAMRVLWPNATPGRHGAVAPITFQPGAFKWTRYRADGLPSVFPTSLIDNRPGADISTRDADRTDTSGAARGV